MITAIVTYNGPSGALSDEQIGAAQKAGENFRDIPGLIRKNFLHRADGVAGGVYTWESREAAEAFYSSRRMDAFRERVGVVDIQYFDTHVIVDNERGELKTAA
jgi:hypothetical protein